MRYAIAGCLLRGLLLLLVVSHAAWAQTAATAQFNPEELVNLTMAVIAINGANRLNIAFRTVPGSYQARQRAAE